MARKLFGRKKALDKALDKVQENLQASRSTETIKDKKRQFIQKQSKLQKLSAKIQHETAESLQSRLQQSSIHRGLSLPTTITAVTSRFQLDKQLLHKLQRQWESLHGNQIPQPLLPILAIQTAELPKCWEALTAARDWARSTSVAHISTLIALTKKLMLPIQQRIVLEGIRKSLLATRAPAWTPANNSAIITPHRAKTLEAIPQFTWLTGQRLGDILRIRRENVYWVPTLQSLALVLVRGKSVGRTGPYTLHLPVPSRAAEIVLDFYRRHMTSLYLFMDYSASAYPAEKDEDHLMLHYEQMIKCSLPEDIRALRRGGLTAATVLGQLEPTQTCLLSRHPDVNTLRIYLGAGLLDAAAAKVHHRAISMNEQALTVSTSDDTWVLSLQDGLANVLELQNQHKSN